MSWSKYVWPTDINKIVKHYENHKYTSEIEPNGGVSSDYGT